MPKRANKYVYLHVVQGRYEPHGWEDLCASTSRREAITDLREYRANAPDVEYRIIERREPNAQN